MIRRRDFLKTSAAAMGVVGLGGAPLSGVGTGAFPRSGPGTPRGMSQAAPGQSLRILILGGTGFIGPHQVQYARERGHSLTLFNRGRTAPELFPGVEQLRGDRAAGDLEALRGREWDVVIDNSSSNPQWTRDSAQLLKDSAGQYLFISTQSVYASRAGIGIDETAPVGRPDLPKDQWSGYGPNKALCEEEAERAFPGRATVVRPSLIVGPGDTTDRWTYWVVRTHRGGVVAVPGTPRDPMQFIDARDLSEWVIRLVENGTAGIFNAVGPGSPLTSAEMFYGIRAVTSTPVSFVWIDADFLEEMGIRPWSDMPAWFPPRGATAGFARMSNARALAAGLTFRPLAVTARETLDWFLSEPGERQVDLRSGMNSGREERLLAAWRVRNGSAETP
jgi:2'-hydroxyisoflavone reductase